MKDDKDYEEFKDTLTTVAIFCWGLGFLLGIIVGLNILR